MSKVKQEPDKLIALRRAAKSARKIAAANGLPIVVFKDGKVTKVKPPIAKKSKR